jgi:uncharacterized protein (TIGR00730 family)
MNEKTVTVFGGSDARPDDPDYAVAYELGATLARGGWRLANGGYGGTMLAAAKGAVEAGGATVGVTCLAFGRGPANRYIQHRIQTESLEERLAALVGLGDAYVVLPGSTGTLLELATVWEMKNKGFLPRRKPVILLGEFFRPLVDLMESRQGEIARCLCRAANPAGVAEILKRLS